MSAGELGVDFFRDLERNLHRPDIRRSRDAVSARLSDDFVEFGSSGRVYDKTAIVDELAKEPVHACPSVPISYDFKLRPLAPEAILLTYVSVGRSDETGTETHVLRSSIWKLIAGRWQMIFHQGTVVTHL